MSELILVSVSRTFIHASFADEDDVVAQRRVSMPACFRYEHPTACKATLHVQLDVGEKATFPGGGSSHSSRTTGQDSDCFESDLDSDCFESDLDLDDFGDFDCQGGADCPKIKKLAFAEHVTFIEPDGMPAVFQYEQPAACKATLHAQLDAGEESTSIGWRSPSSSRSTDLDSDCFEVDSDLDDLEEFDCQAGVVCLKSKKLLLDEHVTYIEPDAMTVAYHWANKEKRETERAWKHSVHAQTQVVQQWQAYQWQLYYCQQANLCAQHLQARMYEGQASNPIPYGGPSRAS